jgi:hypothetical protein
MFLFYFFLGLITVILLNDDWRDILFSLIKFLWGILEFVIFCVLLGAFLVFVFSLIVGAF